MYQAKTLLHSSGRLLCPHNKVAMRIKGEIDIPL